jgi:hypothetical protein
MMYERPAREKTNLPVRFAAIALVAAAIAAAGWYFDPAQFMRSYLVGWLYWFSISLGSLLLLLLHNLTGGGWGWRVRHILVAAASTLPLVGLLFLPIALNLVHLYVWADAKAVVGNPLLEHKEPYLKPSAFYIRAGVYWIIWLASLALARYSSHNVHPYPTDAARRVRVASGIALALSGLAVTFASFDLAMSLEPEWFSTIYGVIFFAGQGLAALAFAIVALVHIDPHAGGGLRAPADDLHDLGKLLLAFTMFWAYVAFSQFLIIWYGNLPEEVVWYRRRTEYGWQWIAIAIALFHFFVPFLLLLGREIKRNARLLAALSLWMLAMRWLDTVWQVEPAFDEAREGLFVPWIDLAITAAVGGFWLIYFHWLLTPVPVPGAVLMPKGEESLVHE